ncbi:TPA: hypothetical protein ACUI23_000025 [Staphylococcus pseudintermedius]
MKYIIAATFLLILVYELYIRLTVNDEIDAFNEYDYSDLINIGVEVSE